MTIESSSAADWWRQAVIYQVYPRSFSDANGDGVGDLQGVLSKADYIADLGVDAVWFSPFYPSALADGGYDIDDYRDIDPLIGSLPQFDAVVTALHARGIRVVVDIVPNHSSDRHLWFLAALGAGPGSRERDRYHFRDGCGSDGELPPNDWQSLFGGPAWTRITEPDGSPGQWYLHLFTTHQPDWNWGNQEVRDDFESTLRFWGDRGVDGFRVDVAMTLTKDMSEPYAAWDSVRSGTFLLGGSSDAFADGANPLFDRDDLDEIYAGWRRVFNTYEPPLFAVAEAWVAAHRRGRYASKAGLGQAFNFDLLSADWDADGYRSIIETNLAFADEHDTTSTWVLSNHDVVRHATRYARSVAAGGASLNVVGEVSDEDAARGLERARAATALLLALPGSTYLYQGEELGLPEVTDIPVDRLQDPSAVVVNGTMVSGRDGCRIPLPWTHGGRFFGFSEADAHLPQPTWFGDLSVETQLLDPSSTLSLYRRALSLRRELLTEERAEWLELGESVLGFRRPNGWVSVTNFGDIPVDLPDGELILRTDGLAPGLPLATDATAWLRSPDSGRQQEAMY
jgi:alpha-glucosidase